MKLRLFLLLLALNFFNHVDAQRLTTYTWDIYKMKFQIYTDMGVTKNDETQFEAKSNNVAFDIYPRKGEKLSYSGMKDAVTRWGNEQNVTWNATNTSGDSQPIYISDLNGYWGCAIDGTHSGYPTTLLLLIDPDYPEISFYVWISYRSESYDDVLKILKSFRPN